MCVCVCVCVCVCWGEGGNWAVERQKVGGRFFTMYLFMLCDFEIIIFIRKAENCNGMYR